MNFQQRIEQAIGKKPDSPEKVFHGLCFALAKEFGWSYSDIINAPIPFVVGLLEELVEFAEKEEAMMKKSQRRKR